jgi:hypothetical protein
MSKTHLMWETPRRIAILAAVVAALAAAIGGYLGYEIARTPSTPQVIINYLPPQAPQK